MRTSLVAFLPVLVVGGCGDLLNPGGPPEAGVGDGTVGTVGHQTLPDGALGDGHGALEAGEAPASSDGGGAATCPMPNAGYPFKATGAGSCKILLKACPNHASVTVGKEFSDAYDGADKDLDRCLARASDYHVWCGAGIGQHAKARWVLSGKEVGSALARSLTRCQIQLKTCSQLDGELIPDTYQEADLDPQRCLQRANEYYNWCGDAGNQVITRFYLGQKLLASAASTTGKDCVPDVLHLGKTASVAFTAPAEGATIAHNANIYIQGTCVNVSNVTLQETKLGTLTLPCLQGAFTKTVPWAAASGDERTFTLTFKSINGITEKRTRTVKLATAAGSTAGSTAAVVTITTPAANQTVKWGDTVSVSGTCQKVGKLSFLGPYQAEKSVGCKSGSFATTIAYPKYTKGSTQLTVKYTDLNGKTGAVQRSYVLPAKRFNLTNHGTVAHWAATFAPHNQRIVSNKHGIFFAYRVNYNVNNADFPTSGSTKWRLVRSTDGGATFKKVFESQTILSAPPAVETDAAGNVYVFLTNFSEIATQPIYMLRFSAAQNFTAWPYEKVITKAAAGKFSTFLDKAKGRIYIVNYNHRNLLGVVVKDFGYDVENFIATDLNGNVLLKKAVLKCSKTCFHYSQVRVADDGKVYLYWHNEEGGSGMPQRRTSHFLVSPDGGKSWWNKTGQVQTPILSDRLGPAPEVTRQDEFWAETSAASGFAVRGNYLLFSYRALFHDTGVFRQNYRRFDRSSFQVVTDLQPVDKGGQLSVWENGFFAARAAATAPIYKVAASNDRRRIVILRSKDAGATWHDFAFSVIFSSDKTHFPQNITGAREIYSASEGIVGALTDSNYWHANNYHRVVSFAVPE